MPSLCSSIILETGSVMCDSATRIFLSWCKEGKEEEPILAEVSPAVNAFCVNN